MSEDDTDFRKTKQMGTPRKVAPQDAPSRPAAGPRGTQLMNSHGPRGTQVNPSVEAPKKREAVAIGVARQGRADDGPKVDVRRADPRHAPTRVGNRRPNAPQPPLRGDDTERKSSRKGPTFKEWFAAAAALLFTLMVGAVVVWIIVHKQQAGAP
ncbi:MAG: hypothetical protein HOW73_41035 [Polyangiaceae bacterium]|nr:hypothetical protein [Polyangiaceae bacterium]